MGPQGPNIDQRSRLEKDRIAQDSPVINIDVSFLHPDIQEPALYDCFQFSGSRHPPPGVTLDSYHIRTLEQRLPGCQRFFCSQETSDSFIQHGLQDLPSHLALLPDDVNV